MMFAKTQKATDAIMEELNRDPRRIRPLRLIDEDLKSGKMTRGQALRARQFVFLFLLQSNEELMGRYSKALYEDLNDTH